MNDRVLHSNPDSAEGEALAQPSEAELAPVTESAPVDSYPVTPDLQYRVENTFQYHPPNASQVPRYEKIRNSARQLAYDIIALTPPSREQSHALTKLEEAVMHANAGIARNE